MKKALSVFTAGIFLLGALAAFSGCAKKIMDEALKSQIFAAVEHAEMMQFEATASIDVDLTAESEYTKIKSKSKQETFIKAYEQDGKIFADIFTDNYSRTDKKTDADQTSETKETYSVEFVRNSETYYTSGNWNDVNVKKKNLLSLVGVLKDRGRILSWQSRVSSSLTGNTAQSLPFGTLAREADAKAYKNGRGYLIKLDAKKILETENGEILEDLLEIGDGGSRKFDGGVTVRLDGEMNVTALSAKIGVSVKEDEDKDIKMQMSAELKLNLKRLKKAPELTDLAGLKADMGYEFMPGEYLIGEFETLIRTSSYNAISGFCSCKATLNEEKLLIMEIKFREENDAFSVSERREYDLSEGQSDDKDFFEDLELPNGQTSWGIYYRLSINAHSGHEEIQIGSQSLTIPSRRMVVDL